MENFNQLCVWQGTFLGESSPQDLVDFFKEEMGTRIKFEQEVPTNPDLDEKGEIIEGTGGRNDLLFYVHDEDITKFAVPRLKMGIRWWEDVISYNDNSHLYSKEVLEKYPITW
jgi:hypothetical protein